EDSARVVALRSRAVADCLVGHGGMLSVSLPAADLKPRLARWEQRLAIAVVNGPGATVVAGEGAALEGLVAGCEGGGSRTRRRPVDYASPPPQVEAIRDRLLVELAAITPRTSEVPFYSTVTGTPVDTQGLDAEYWYTNLRQTVEFERTIRALVDGGYR